MAMTPEAYRDQLIALAPPGSALSSDVDSNWAKLLHAVSEELARVDARADDLIDEADPRTTYELLADWERVAGLPDACITDPGSVAGRRNALLGRIAGTGGQSRDYYIGLARDLGFDITITEFKTPDCGVVTAGEPINGVAWRFTWRVNAPQTAINEAVAGSATVGEALRAWGNEVLECALTARKPAHTEVQFAYGG